MANNLFKNIKQMLNFRKRSRDLKLLDCSESNFSFPNIKLNCTFSQPLDT